MICYNLLEEFYWLNNWKNKKNIMIVIIFKLIKKKVNIW